MGRPNGSQEYRDLRTAEYDGHDDSATEVSDTTPGHNEEKGWKDGQHHDKHQGSKLRRLRTIDFSLRGLLDTVLLLVIVGLLLERRQSQEGYGQLEGSGDITGFAPRSKCGD